MIYDQSLFCRTRRDMSAGGFLTTIHSMIDVAAARAYLGALGLVPFFRTVDLPCKNILGVVIPQVYFCGSADRYPFRFSIPSHEQIRLCMNVSNCCKTSAQ